MKRLLALLAFAGLISHAQGQTYPGQTSVLAFGAVCNGSTNDTTAIQNAINSFGTTPGRLLFPSGRTCAIGSTITVGNGTSSTLSTQNGIVLDCDGESSATSFFGSQVAASGCRILWIGGAGTPMIAINGPIQGWGLRNLYIDCTSAAAVGVQVTSAQGGLNWGNTINGCTTQGVLEQTFSQFSGNNTNNERNHWDHTTVILPNVASAAGVVQTGQATDTTSDTHNELWTDTTFYVPGTTTTFTVIGLQTADANVWVRTQIFGGGSGCTAVSYNYSQHNGFPASNSFYSIDPGSGCAGGISNTGTPGAAAANYIYGFVETNGAAIPNIANLAVFSSHRMVFSPGGNTNNVQYLPVPSTIAGLPTCNSASKGAIAFVSDTVANAAATFRGTVTGGGANTVNGPVSCNGTNWQYD